MGSNTKSKLLGRRRRKLRVHKKVLGDSERPRLTVHRSLRHMNAQIIDDSAGSTICSLSTKSKEVIEQAGGVKGKIAMGGLLGKLLAQKAKEKGVEKIRFDRGGHAYHGRVRAVAEAAREEGLEF